MEIEFVATERPPSEQGRDVVRYRGTLDGVDVEVRGGDAVDVQVSGGDGVMLIVIGDTVVRLSGVRPPPE